MNICLGTLAVGQEPKEVVYGSLNYRSELMYNYFNLRGGHIPPSERAACVCVADIYLSRT